MLWFIISFLERGRKGPLDSATLIDHFVVPNSRDVTRLEAGNLLYQLKRRFGRTPSAKHVSATPMLCHKSEDVEIGKSRPWSPPYLSDQANTAFRIDQRAILLTPSGRRKIKIRVLCGFSCGVHILHDKKIQLLQTPIEFVLMNPGVGAVGGNHPKRFNLACIDAIQDLLVGPTRFA